MKKLLALLLLLPTLAFGVALSPGQSLSVECVNVGTVVVVPPVVVPPVVTPPVTYPGPNLWGKRMNFSLSLASPGVDGGFSVPAGTYLVEFPESGSNVNIVLDGVMTSQDGRVMTGPSNHLLRVQLTSGAPSADGSIGVAHTP